MKVEVGNTGGRIQTGSEATGMGKGGAKPKLKKKKKRMCSGRSSLVTFDFTIQFLKIHNRRQ